MIRWSYVVPRLIVLALLVATAHVFVPVVLRWSTVYALQLMTGTSVQVDRAWASLARGRVRIDGVQIARSRSADKNLLEFESATLAIDLNALARRQTVIDSAQIRGIQLDTIRQGHGEPGRKIQFPTPDTRAVVKKGRELSHRWMRRAVQMLQRRVEEEFESIRVARQLADRWPLEYQQLASQVRTCKQSAERLHEALAELPVTSFTPRELAALQAKWDNVKALRQESVRLRALIERISHRVAEDRTTLLEAFAHDREKLRREMHMAALDAGSLNDFLLNNEVRQWWDRMQSWIVLARLISDSPEINQLAGRGTLVQYDTPAPGPGFLIRRATLDGKLSIAGQSVDFIGKGWNICADPESNGQPVRLQILTRGPFAAMLSADIDQSRGTPKNHIEFKCVDLPLPRRTMGDETLSVSVAPGTAHIDARLGAFGGDVLGQVVLVQREVALTMAAGGSNNHDVLLDHLQEAAEGIEKLEIAIDITGTFDAPQWKIRSSFGSTFRTRLQRVVQEAIDRHAEKLITEADRKMNSKLVRLQEQIAAWQQDLMQQLGIGDRLLSSLTDPVASRMKPFGRLLRKF